MSPDVTIESPAVPGATFRLWRGWQADQAVRDELRRSELARWPHHSCSQLAILGQARHTPDGVILRVQPGELLLAGAGVLVLQDLPEWKRGTLEEIARAWRRGHVRLATVRAGGGVDELVVELPVRCSLMATAQACPCGFVDRPSSAACACTEAQITRWNERVNLALAWLRGVSRV